MIHQPDTQTRQGQNPISQTLLSLILVTKSNDTNNKAAARPPKLPPTKQKITTDTKSLLQESAVLLGVYISKKMF